MATMRPTTPNFNFANQAGPSSPPSTPTTPSFRYKQYQTRRNGTFFAPAPSNDIPRSSNQTLSSFYTQPSELSPRSSSPTSSTHSSELSGSSPPPRSNSSSPRAPISSSPPKIIRTRIVAETKANFTVEEFGESDYEDFSETDSIIRPTQYEDAESDRAPSLTGRAPVSRQLDPRVLSAFNNLACDNSEEEEDDDEDDEGYREREAYLKKIRDEKRRRRRSSATFKRTLAQSIGSDTDEEDLLPNNLDANDAGSSARRLRRRTGERLSLLFDDPPIQRIEELEEPESCEELVEVSGEGDDEREGLSALPYWVQEDMEWSSDGD